MTTTADITWNTEIPEVFHFLGTHYDVQKAKQILASKPRIIASLPVSDVAFLVGKPDTWNIAVTIDWKKARKADTSVPLILAYSARGNLMPIDGYHRIGRAVLEKKTALPAVVLSEEESREVWCL